jgi:hypothetical protein
MEQSGKKHAGSIGSGDELVAITAGKRRKKGPDADDRRPFFCSGN